MLPILVGVFMVTFVVVFTSSQEIFMRMLPEDKVLAKKCCLLFSFGVSLVVSFSSYYLIIQGLLALWVTIVISLIFLVIVSFIWLTRTRL